MIREIKAIWFGLMNPNATVKEKSLYLFKIGAIKKSEIRAMEQYLTLESIKSKLDEIE